ncbi:MAG: hypothetical protein NXI31_24770 [bacterium]|nr:hypothetical protein [bacterium]
MADRPEIDARRFLVAAWVMGPLPVGICWVALHLPVEFLVGTFGEWFFFVGTLALFGQLAAAVAFFVAWLLWPAGVRSGRGGILMTYFLVMGCLFGSVLFRVGHGAGFVFLPAMWFITALAVSFPFANWPASARQGVSARENPDPAPHQQP